MKDYSLMRVRDKNQKIVISIALILIGIVLAGVIVLIAAPPIFHRSIETSFEQEQIDSAVSRSLRLMNWFPYSDQAREAAYKLLSMKEEGELYVTVGHGIIMRSGTVKDVLPQAYHDSLFALVLKVAKWQRNRLWDYNLHERLGDVFSSIENYPEAIDHYTYAAEHFIGLNMDARAFAIYMKLSDVAKEQDAMIDAGHYLAKAGTLDSPGSIASSELYARKGMLAIALGDLDQAEQHFIEAMRLVNLGIQEAQSISDDRSMVVDEESQVGFQIARRGLLELDMLRNSDPNTIVSGRLTAMNQPLSGVIVTLIPADETRLVFSPVESRRYNLQTITDAYGNFSFSRVVPGDYTYLFSFKPDTLLNLGRFAIPESFSVSQGSTVSHEFNLSERMKITHPEGFIEIPYGETITLRWEKVEHAAWYSIGLVYFHGPEASQYQNSIGTDVARTTGESFAVSTDSIEARSPLHIYDPSTLIIASVIGPYHPEARFTFKVTAYDDNGTILTDSEGLIFDRGANYPLWHIIKPSDYRLMPEGDVALLEGDVDEAMRLYEKAARTGDTRSSMAYEALVAYRNYSL